MLLRVLVVQLCFCATSSLFGQGLLEDQDASPIAGDTSLTAYFLEINFTDKQRAYVCQFRWNLNFKIDKTGSPYLLPNEFNGNRNPDIWDSLARRTTRLRRAFYPQIRDGRPVQSTYSLSLLFSCAGNNPKLLRVPFSEDRFDREKVKSYYKSFHRIDFLMSLLTSQVSGDIARYLDPGFGFNMEITAPCGIVNAGVLISYSEHHRNIEYPDLTSVKQDATSSVYFFGVGVNRTFSLNNRRDLMIQIEMMMAGQEIVHSNSNYPDGINIKGWSPGLTMSYMVQVGRNQFWNTARHQKDKERQRPVLVQNFLNIHAGIRKLDFKSNEASGWMCEIGIGYRLSQNYLKGYELN